MNDKTFNKVFKLYKEIDEKLDSLHKVYSEKIVHTLIVVYTVIEDNFSEFSIFFHFLHTIIY